MAHSFQVKFLARAIVAFIGFELFWLLWRQHAGDAPSFANLTSLGMICFMSALCILQQQKLIDQMQDQLDHYCQKYRDQQKQFEHVKELVQQK